MDPNYTYQWSTGASGSSISVSENGTYVVTVTDYLCASDPISTTVNVTEPLEQGICMVTVDTLLNRNLIVWEKPATGAIHSFNIYKETSTDYYQMVGSQLYDELSEYVDFASQPSVHADKYKISIIDTCGNESALSFFHQTMNLSQAQGIEDDEVVLIWNKYIDESGSYIPANYLIYRGVDVDNMILENTLTGGLSTYNYNLHGVVNGEHFMVAVDMPECAPLEDAKASGGPYYQSMSNIEDEGIIATGIRPLLAEELEIYPNPMQDYTVIKSDVKLEQVKIYTVTGELVRNISGLNANEYKLLKDNLSVGTYILEINRTNHQKLIVE